MVRSTPTLLLIGAAESVLIDIWWIWATLNFETDDFTELPLTDCGELLLQIAVGTQPLISLNLDKISFLFWQMKNVVRAGCSEMLGVRRTLDPANQVHQENLIDKILNVMTPVSNYLEISLDWMTRFSAFCEYFIWCWMENLRKCPTRFDADEYRTGKAVLISRNIIQQQRAGKQDSK